MQKIALLLILVFGCPWGSDAQTDSILSVKTTEKLITQLADPKWKGRYSTSEGFEKAAQIAVDFMASHQVKPLIGTSYYDYLEDNMFNVLASVHDFDVNKPTIILSAHLDHLQPYNENIFPGANDNASGSTAVIQMSAALAQRPHNKNIIIALLTGEEMGLLGSKYMAKKFKTLGLPIEAVYNFEMIGVPMSTEYPSQVYITGYDCSDFAQQANQMIDQEFIRRFNGEVKHQLFRRSDNYAFYKAYDIPSHTISSFVIDNYDYYHKAGDRVEQLSLPFLNSVIVKMTEVMEHVADGDMTVTYFPENCANY